MTKALTTGFDTSKIVNRVAQRLVLDAPHPLLAGRIEWNKDRLGGSNPHLLTAKTVADIVRTTCVYPVGRPRRGAGDTRPRRAWRPPYSGQSVALRAVPSATAVRKWL